MTSRRYVVALVAALLVALAPTIRGGYVGHSAKAAVVSADSLPAEVAGVRGIPKVRTGGWIKDTYGADSWAERTYDIPGAGQIGLFVARGFDMKKLYHHPELGVMRGHLFEPQRTQPLEGDPMQVVHVLRSTADRESAVYALLHEGRWIANPYVLQLSSAFTTLWTGPRPLTLVFAYGPVLANREPSPSTVELLRRSAQQLATSSTEHP